MLGKPFKGCAQEKNKRSLSILPSLKDSPRNKGNKEQVLSGKLGANLDCQ